MNCGTPVITSEGSCFPEVAGDGGIYINPLSPFQIAKALYDITSNLEFRDQLVENAIEQAKKFSTENTNKLKEKLPFDV